jgi:hypothetical protein
MESVHDLEFSYVVMMCPPLILYVSQALIFTVWIPGVKLFGMMDGREELE